MRISYFLEAGIKHLLESFSQPFRTAHSYIPPFFLVFREKRYKEGLQYFEKISENKYL